jgi:hypothetical protein
MRCRNECFERLPFIENFEGVSVFHLVPLAVILLPVPACQITLDHAFLVTTPIEGDVDDIWVFLDCFFQEVIERVVPAPVDTLPDWVFVATDIEINTTRLAQERKDAGVSRLFWMK